MSKQSFDQSVLAEQLKSVRFGEDDVREAIKGSVSLVSAQVGWFLKHDQPLYQFELVLCRVENSFELDVVFNSGVKQIDPMPNLSLVLKAKDGRLLASGSESGQGCALVSLPLNDPMDLVGSQLELVA